MISTQATRNNLRDFGTPTSGTWFGRGRTPDYRGTPVTIETHGRGVTVRNTTGVVDSFGRTAKFWFIPAGAEAAAAAADAEHAAELDKAVAHATVYLADLDARTATQRADNVAATATALADSTKPIEPTETTWAAMGRPALAVYYGQPWRRETPRLVTFNEYGNRMYDALTGDQIGFWASDVRKMLAPAPTAREVAPATTAPVPVVIVPCGGKKAPGVLPAGEKYIGSYHLQTRKAAAAIAEHTGARVLILSALYGLLELDTPVDDYDLQMGDPGSVTAGRVAEQAAALGITDAMVTVIAGKRYADVVTAVWPHAARVLDGTNGMPHQMKRMAEIARGEWRPTAATAAPALFGADLVAPPAIELTAAADLQRGDVLAPGAPARTPTAQLEQSAASDQGDEMGARVEIQRGDVLTVPLVSGVDVSLAWRADEGDYRVTVLQRGSAQLIERPRHFNDEGLARQHARGMVISYRTTGEPIVAHLDTSRRATTVDLMPNQQLSLVGEPAKLTASPTPAALDTPAAMADDEPARSPTRRPDLHTDTLFALPSTRRTRHRQPSKPRRPTAPP